jgi:hypothetical protein
LTETSTGDVHGKHGDEPNENSTLEELLQEQQRTKARCGVNYSENDRPQRVVG